MPTDFSPVVVAPTFNNAATLHSVVQRVLATGLPLIVVNDGSTDATPEILSRLFHNHSANRALEQTTGQPADQPPVPTQYPRPESMSPLGRELKNVPQPTGHPMGASSPISGAPGSRLPGLPGLPEFPGGGFRKGDPGGGTSSGSGGGRSGGSGGSGGELVEVVHHPVNLGKAHALRTGFRVATSHGFTHAATIDTDDQHDPEELPRLVDTARQHPAALVLGVRSETIAGYPGRSLLGRRLTNRMIQLESGSHVADSQCGFRVYPLRPTLAVGARSGRFNYETEIITRWFWASLPIVETPITSRYHPGPQRVTHFRPYGDTARGVALHVRLVAGAAARWLRSLPRATSTTRRHQPTSLAAKPEST